MRTTLLVAALALTALAPAGQVSAQSSEDKAIALEIGNQLKSSGQLRDYRIGVKYKDGTAALTGTVANREQLMTAVRLTQQMPGVDQVVNNLSISQSNAATNPGLAKPAAQIAARANYTSPSGRNELAMRTSYQQAANNGPMMRQGINQPMSQQMGPPMRPAMGQGQMTQPNPAMGRNLNQLMNQPMNQNPNMGPLGPRPQRPPYASRMPAQGRGNMPMPMGGRPRVQQAMAQQPMQAMQAGCNCGPGGYGGGYGGGMDGPPAAMGYVPGGQSGAVNYDNAQMPGYAWPSYASYPNYAALTYPQQYSPTAWPYIGPFYPYPQVPLGWRKVALEWDDGWWFLDFSDCGSNH